MDNKNSNFLDSLIKVTENKAQKKRDSGKKNSDNAIVRVALFGKKQEINALKERIRTEPVVRVERVNEIRKMIRNEAFTINSKLVVRSILKSHLLDELLR